MKLEEVLPALRAGKRIRRISYAVYVIFSIDKYIFSYQGNGILYKYEFNAEDIFADDWIILEDEE